MSTIDHTNRATDTAGGVALSPLVRLWVPVSMIGATYAISLGDHPLYQRIVDGEFGIIENLQLLLLGYAIYLAARLITDPAIRADRLLVGWLVLAIAGTVYVAGEEMSWGQHFLGWGTPEWFAARNDQNETNLHNMSSWFDQKPRILLEVGIVLGGIVHPLLKHYRGRGIVERPWWLMPTIALLPTALLAELTRAPDRLADFGLLTEEALIIRSSELQELYYYYFIVLYLIVLRARSARRAGAETKT